MVDSLFGAKDQDALNDWVSKLPKCGCGRTARYQTSSGLACNKHFRCDDAEFQANRIVMLEAQVVHLAEKSKAAKELLMSINSKDNKKATMSKVNKALDKLKEQGE